MHGFGNDFIIIEKYRELSNEKIKFLCDRRVGIGCDQLLFVDFFDNFIEMKTYNSDGGEAKFCGNGARCIVGLSHILQKVSVGQEFFIKNNDDYTKSSIDENDLVTVNIGKPKFYQENVFDVSRLFDEANLGSFINLKGMYLNVGNPHIVFFVKNFDFDIEFIGQKIQSDDFFVDGVNVNFARIIDSGLIELKTFERGAGLTNACGSGACATAFSALKKGFVKSNNIKIQFSNESDFLCISIQNEEIIMKGGYSYVFSGEINIDI
jgi:diaminopimelate epimerase